VKNTFPSTGKIIQICNRPIIREYPVIILQIGIISIILNY